MSQSSILQFCYLLEAQIAFNLDEAIEDEVHDIIHKKQNAQSLPWIKDESSLQQTALDFLDSSTTTSSAYQYRVFIAPFHVSEVLEVWRKKLSGTAEVPLEQDERADYRTCYGAFRIDGQGALVKDSLELSSVPLLLGLTQHERLEDVANRWNLNGRFCKYQKDVRSFFNSQARELEGKHQPVTAEKLRDIANRIARNYGNWRLPRFQELGYWVRCTPGQKETSFPKSYFLEDLERVGRFLKRGDRAGSAFDAYLSNHIPERVDMDRKQVQQAVLSPNQLPLGRWPANPDHHLSLQQQCAVNLAMQRSNTALFSVNGPPGTGKTTMLRDIVANIVVQRAVKLCAFSDPDSAFTEPDEASETLPYSIDSSITGYEIVVASSNNGAVENISKELPAITSIAAEYRKDIDYFSQTASSLLQSESLGLFSAALGNRRNKSSFVEKFWPRVVSADEPCGFFTELEQLPPLDWNKTRQTFLSLKADIEAALVRRQRYAEAVRSHGALRQQLQSAQQALISALQQYKQHEQTQQHMAGRIEIVRARLHQTETELRSLMENKPPLTQRLLSIFIRRSAIEAYRALVSQTEAKVRSLGSQMFEEEGRLRSAEQALAQAKLQLVDAKRAADGTSTRFSANQALLTEGRQQLGKAFADEAWWSRSESAIQMDVPWIDRALDDARARLFIAAMDVQRAFIQQTAGKLSRNIELWVDLLEQGWPKSRVESHALTLWQSAFLVIPVISTTFASVQSMFKLLREESIGWLLIDEAGQAVPQAAVGALWRARRAVVVGDPLQLEPVFTMHSGVVEQLRRYFELMDCWNPYSCSVQGLADRVNPYGAEIKQQGEPLWVGCPLRVHRRCIEPMFSISNEIAYGGKMVLATQDSGIISFPEDESRWIQVAGTRSGKHWVPEQGDAVVELLEQVLTQSSEIPEIFVITPFREVGRQLKRLLKRRYADWMPVQSGSSFDVGRWLAGAIGTVHTFQGKEADIVVFVLGLDGSQNGVAWWAAQRPNLLNVAVTRARYRLYVVGDRRLWQQQGCFKKAVELLR